jgi:hypothetical protein
VHAVEQVQEQSELLVIIETDDSRRHSHNHRAAIEVWMREPATHGRLVGGEAFDTEQLEPVTVRARSAAAAAVPTRKPTGPGAAGGLAPWEA